MFWARYNVLWWAIFGQVLIAGLLIRVGITHFNREELLGKELDALNLRWSWRVFTKAFLGQARSPGDWFRREISATLRTLAVPIGVMALVQVAAIWLGAGQARVFVLPTNLLNWHQLDQGFIRGLESIRFFSAAGIGTVWLHNLRAVLLATALGMFSFGVLAVIVLMLPLMILGYFMASLANSGLPPLLFFSTLVLPHGILEIPAIILAGAAILRLGATLAAPAHDQTIGEAWLRSLADWAKIMVGLVLPLLLGAAALEVLLTPRLAVWILGG
jgi:stage II sporulation protein M